MTQQYLRHAQLGLFSNQAGVDVSNMHFTFSTTSYVWQTGNICNIRLYDLDEPTVGRVQGEFTDLTLNAGYEDNPPTIFQGTIVQVRRGWEGDKAERYIDITAIDGDRALAYSIIEAAIENGSTYKQRWAAIASALKLPLDLQFTDDQLPKELLNQLPRGKTLFTGADDAARDQAMHMMCTWSIQNGRIKVIPYDGYPSGEAVDINGLTGMIGWPEQTDEGVRVQTLLNGRLNFGQRVHINNADTLQQQLNLISGGGEAPSEWQIANKAGLPGGRTIVSTDGMYRIIEMTHSGDTRGNEWYSDLLCLSTDPNQQQVTPFVNSNGHF
jgi:hypothetical protein